MDIKNLLRIIREQVSPSKSYRLGQMLAQGKAGDFPGPLNIPALKAGMSASKTGVDQPQNVIAAYKLGKEVAKQTSVVPEFPKGMRYFNPILRKAILQGFTKGTAKGTANARKG